MSYRNKTYVIFDGDKDIWAYGRMKGWNALPTIDFTFSDAHDLNSSLTDRASELTIKRRLRERFSNAKQAVVLIGENTKNLYRFVRWELDLALELDLPIIAVNLNNKRAYDHECCPPILRGEYVVHVPFKLAIIKHALNQFPDQYHERQPNSGGPLHYPDKVYQDLGILPQPSDTEQLRDALLRPGAPSSDSPKLNLLTAPPPLRLTSPPPRPNLPTPPPSLPPLPRPNLFTLPPTGNSTLANLLRLASSPPPAPERQSPFLAPFPAHPSILGRTLQDLFNEPTTPPTPGVLPPWWKK